MLHEVEAPTGGVLEEKVFIEILQNSQENTCVKVSFFNKFAGLRSSVRSEYEYVQKFMVV